MPNSRRERDMLKLIADAGIIDRRATLDDLIELSERLERDSDGDGGDALNAWAFIVKGKFVFKDDSEPAGSAGSAGSVG